MARDVKRFSLHGEVCGSISLRWGPVKGLSGCRALATRASSQLQLENMATIRNRDTAMSSIVLFVSIKDVSNSVPV